MNTTQAKTTGRRKLLPLVLLPALILAGCTSGPPPAAPSPSATTIGPSASDTTAAPSATSATASDPSPAETPNQEPSQSSTSTPQARPSTAEKTLAAMTLEERIGQVLMIGIAATGSTAADRSTIAAHELGNVFLKGRSSAGAAGTATVVKRVEAIISGALDADVEAFVATDQEGGYVQVLKGNGFSTLPTALVQGGWSAATLRNRATTWGSELAKAGINVNLAPVADTVSSAAFAPSNAPIGYWKREFGYDTGTVSTASRAFSAGMLAAGVDPVIKHFPGLGRVTKNTDTTKNVSDTKTTRNDPYLKPFKDGIAEGNDWVMVSNAYYSKIDAKNIAPFSSTIMRGMLRDDLGFKGIIVSDDMCDAAQLSPWSSGTRALRFFEAGGTMMLCVEAGDMPAIAKALYTKAKSDPAFAETINAAALRVLVVKERKF